MESWWRSRVTYAVGADANRVERLVNKLHLKPRCLTNYALHNFFGLFIIRFRMAKSDNVPRRRGSARAGG